MNELPNKKEEPKRQNTPPPEKVCQFYIVLGNHNRVFQNDETHRFFPLKGNEDTDLIQYALAEEWKKKKKEKIKVASEIIFLVPDITYKDAVKDLMDKLNCRGKFRVLKPIKKEIKEEPKEIIKEEPNIKSQEVVELPKETPQETPEVPKKEPIVKKEPTKEVSEATNDFTPVKVKTRKYTEDNIYHKEINFPTVDNKKRKKEEDKDVSSYMWGDLGKKELTNKKIDLPVIVFIISALFLIGAVVLIFILK